MPMRSMPSQYCSVKEEGGIVFAAMIREHRSAEIEAFLTLNQKLTTEPEIKPHLLDQ